MAVASLDHPCTASKPRKAIVSKSQKKAKKRLIEGIKAEIDLLDQGNDDDCERRQELLGQLFELEPAICSRESFWRQGY